MTDRLLMRVAGGAAVAGAIAQLAASVLEPDWGGELGDRPRYRRAARNPHEKPVGHGRDARPSCFGTHR